VPNLIRADSQRVCGFAARGRIAGSPNAARQIVHSASKPPRTSQSSSFLRRLIAQSAYRVPVGTVASILKVTFWIDLLRPFLLSLSGQKSQPPQLGQRIQTERAATRLG